MPFNIGEYRFVQWRTNNSAANALNVSTYYPVPENKIWTVIAIGYKPSVAETKIISAVKVDSGSREYALLNPVSLALVPASATFLDAGSYIELLPGETVKFLRDSATAGSTMGVYFQFVEWDMPLYDYTEPQEAKRIRKNALGLFERPGVFGGGFSGGGAGGGRGTGGAGGRPRPK